MKVLLGYAGQTVVNNENQYILGQGQPTHAIAAGTVLAVYDLSGQQVSGVQIRRLQFLETVGAATPNNGIVALDMGTQGLPSYSLDIDIGDMYCSSLDKAATLVVGVMGDVACFPKNSDQGKFIDLCLQPGAFGHVETNGADPVCVSKVPPQYALNQTGNGVTGSQRETTGDPLVLSYSYALHRDLIGYLPYYRQLQGICDNPSMPAGHLVSQPVGMGTSSSVIDQTSSYSDIQDSRILDDTSTTGGNSAAVRQLTANRPLAYCQCRPVNAGSLGSGTVTFDILAEAKRIKRVIGLWNGKKPPTDPLVSFQQACQDGTALELSLPDNLPEGDRISMANEMLCGRLQGLRRARVGEGRCLCSRSVRTSGYNDDSYSSYGGYGGYNRQVGAQTTAVPFASSSEDFINSCLMISDGMTMKDFCNSSGNLSYDRFGSSDDDAKAESKGCSGCPVSGYSTALARKKDESLAAYALRCYGITR
jgi:hypothetical protein